MGWAFAGPIGGILGFAIGSMFDKAGSTEYSRLYSPNSAREHTQTGDFGASLLILAAAVMKADGQVLKSELEYVKRFFVQQFGIEKTRGHMELFKGILKQNIPLREVCEQIKHFTRHSDRLQLVHFLFGISGADGRFADAEMEVISQISGMLGVSQADYQSIRSMFVRESNADYKILEVEADASDEEIKKAYRRMAVKYHPDKVSHLGDDFQKMAVEKFQKVQEAYENIRKKRGFN